METRANYIMVGFFVLLLAFGLLGFVLWLAKFQFEQEFARYDIVFDSAVTGLNEGSPVRYRGVRVGEVISVDLDPDRPTAIRATIEVQKRTPVRADSASTLAHPSAMAMPSAPRVTPVQLHTVAVPGHVTMLPISAFVQSEPVRTNRHNCHGHTRRRRNTASCRRPRFSMAGS